MKVLFRIGLLVILLFGKVAAQDTAVVTSLRQEVRIYPMWRSILNEESFPDYLEADSLWQTSVTEKLQQLLKQKFGLSHVLFAKTKPVEYLVTGSVPKQNSAFTANSGDLQVDIQMVITLATTSMDDNGIQAKNFNQTCRLRIKDKENKPVYESSIVIPFRTRVNVEKGMYGLAELSAADLKQLFEESLTAAFSYTSKKFPVHAYDRPVFAQAKYKAFVEKAQLYALQEFSPDVPLQKGQPQQNRHIFHPFNKNAEATQLSLTRNYTGNIQMLEGGYTCRAVLKNEVTMADYQMWATIEWKNKSEDSTPPAGDEKPEVLVKCFSEGLQLGDFTLSPKKFEGMTGYTSFIIYQTSPKNTLELRVNDQVKALIQKSGISNAGRENIQQYYLYLPAGSSQEEKAELLTIFMIYKVASEFGQDYL